MILPKVHSQYGAPMGRRENISGRQLPVKFHLQHVRINQGGYDDGGAYWGIGTPLYRAYGEAPGEEGQDFYLRTSSREDAKVEVLQKFPRASFFR